MMSSMLFIDFSTLSSCFPPVVFFLPPSSGKFSYRAKTRRNKETIQSRQRLDLPMMERKELTSKACGAVAYQRPFFRFAQTRSITDFCSIGKAVDVIHIHFVTRFVTREGDASL